MKVAFITGITGQDGSYLSELLLNKYYTIYGMIRRSSTINTRRLDNIYADKKLNLRYGDILDITSIINILNEIINGKDKFDILEIYNLAAQSHVKVSFELPIYTGQVDAIGVLNILEAVRQLHLESKVKIYQASSSELYGKIIESPQSEITPFNPQSPYAVSKLYSYWITKVYRQSYDMFISNGILFNHESPRRGETFVTRKITRGISAIIKGKQEFIELGNLDASRDWGHAKDYVEAMWLILQQSKPDDYVIATNSNHTVREFVEKAFRYIDIEIKWRDTDINEEGYDPKTGKVYVKVNSKYFRPSEVDTLLGNSDKAKKELGWIPKISFEDLIREMVDSDMKSIE